MIKLTDRERARIRRWTRGLLDEDGARLDVEARALEIVFENMLRDRLPELACGPLDRYRQAAAARARLSGNARKGSRRGLQAAGGAQGAG